MPSKNKLIFEKITKHYVITIFVITTLTWLPVLFIPFINDDIQILSYIKGSGLSLIFQPFIKQDISGFYWRPVGNILHPLIILIGGFNPFLFRLVSLITYVFCCVLFIKVGEKIGLEKRITIIFAVIFSVLPSHELQLAWIADQGESLLTIFLLLSFIFYCNIYSGSGDKRKNTVFAVLFFLLSILVKETAYAGILIPMVVLVSQNDYKKNRLLKSFRDSGIGLLIVFLTLTYRYIFIGGSPFGSDHFSDFTINKAAAAFFIYIPLSFIPPEFLEWLNSISVFQIFVLLILLTILIIIIYLIIKTFRSDNMNRNILLTGGLWYIIFIIPALPTLMRWYVFAASLGIMWILASIVQNWKEFFTSKKILIAILLIISGTAVYDFSLMTRWVSAGANFSAAIKSMSKYTSEITSRSLLIWVTPDKINRIPVMKLGVQQSVQWLLKNDSIDVSSPFRVEMINDQSRIKIISNSDSSIIFQVLNGRFLPLGGQSHYEIRNEILSGKIYNLNYNIRTVADGIIPISDLTVSYSNTRLPEDQLYFNGKEFVKIR